MKHFKLILILIALSITAFATIAYAAPVIQFQGNVAPFVTNTYDNGTSTNVWKNVWTNGLQMPLQSNGCAQFSSGSLTSTGSNCSGSSGSTFPFTVTGYGVSTSTTIGLLNGFLSNASSTINSTLNLPTLTTGGLSVSASGLVYSAATTTAGTGLTYSGNQFNVNTSQNIATLSNFSTNGFLKTSSGNGTLIIDTNTYLTSATTPIATSTAENSGQLAFWTTTSGTPAKLSSVATSSETCSSPLSCTSFNIIGSGGAISLNTIGIANGGTATTTGGVTNGVEYYNGSVHTNSYNLIFDGTNLGVGTTTPYALLSVGNTNGIGFTNATSTFNTTGGINLQSGGCFAVIGTCINATITNNLAYKSASNYATTAALPANTYLSGVLTEVGTGALSVDGSSPAIGNRILVKNEVTGKNNGIYTVTATGSGIAAYVLTRATDFNTNNEVFPGVTTYVLSGTVNNDSTWVLTTAAPITLDTTALTFTEQAGAGASVASVSATYPIQSTGGTTPVISTAFGTTTANTFGPTQTFGNASTTNLTTSNELNIPHSGIVPTLSQGDIYQNTNSIASSSIQTSESPLFNVHSVSTVLASSTLVYMGNFGASGTTTLPVVNSLHTVTIQSFGCTTDQGTAWVAFGTGLATTTAVQCNSTGKFITVSSNNVFVGRKLIKMDVGTSASSPNTITVTTDVEDSN